MLPLYHKEARPVVGLVLPLCFTSFFSTFVSPEDSLIVCLSWQHVVKDPSSCPGSMIPGTKKERSKFKLHLSLKLCKINCHLQTSLKSNHSCVRYMQSTVICTRMQTCQCHIYIFNRPVIFTSQREVGGLKNPFCRSFGRSGGMDIHRGFCLQDLSRLTLSELISILQAVVSEVARRAHNPSTPEASAPSEGYQAAAEAAPSNQQVPITPFQCSYSCAILGCQSHCTRAKRIHRHHRCRAHQGD